MAHGVRLLPRSRATAGAFTADGTRRVPATEIGDRGDGGDRLIGGRHTACACYRDQARPGGIGAFTGWRTAHGVGLLPSGPGGIGGDRLPADGTRRVPATEITRARREHCPVQFDRFLCDSAACRPALSRVGNYKWARWEYFEFSATECHLVPSGGRAAAVLEPGVSC